MYFFLKGLGLFLRALWLFLKALCDCIYISKLIYFSICFLIGEVPAFPNTFYTEWGEGGYPPPTWLIPTFQTKFISICNNISATSLLWLQNPSGAISKGLSFPADPLPRSIGIHSFSSLTKNSGCYYCLTTVVFNWQT